MGGDYKFVIPPQLYVGKVKLDEAERGATLLQDRTWGPFRFRGSDKQKAAQRVAQRAKRNAGFAQRNVSLLQNKDSSEHESYLGGPSDGVCLPLFMELNVFTDNGALFILGMPFLRAYSVRFDLSKQTIGLKKLPLGSSMCASCSGSSEGGKHGKNHGGGSNHCGCPLPAAPELAQIVAGAVVCTVHAESRRDESLGPMQQYQYQSCV